MVLGAAVKNVTSLMENVNLAYRTGQDIDVIYVLMVGMVINVSLFVARDVVVSAQKLQEVVTVMMAGLGIDVIHVLMVDMVHNVSLNVVRDVVMSVTKLQEYVTVTMTGLGKNVRKNVETIAQHVPRMMDVQHVIMDTMEQHVNHNVTQDASQELVIK